jgi:hypothetical protein
MTDWLKSPCRAGPQLYPRKVLGLQQRRSYVVHLAYATA